MTTFNQLNFTGVDTEGTPRLKTGVHPVRISEAEFKPNKSGTGNVVVVRFEALEGGGTMQATFNVQHVNPDAQKIGQQQFKTLLIAAKHPNPDHPNDIRSLLNLTLRLVVEENGTYQGSDGKHYPNYEVAKRGAFQPMEQTMSGNAQFDAQVQAQHEFMQSAQPQPQQGYGQQPQQPAQQQPNYGQGGNGFPI